MIRITKETEYAFLLLSALLKTPGFPLSASSLSEHTGIATPVTGKVLKKLVKEKVLSSLRGAYGGYQLAQAPEKVTILEVVRAMEGRPELVECATKGVGECALAHRCHISPFWQALNAEITELLATRTLADMLSMESTTQRHTHEQ